MVPTSCGWSEDRYQSQIKGQFENVVSIEFEFETPYGKRQIVNSESEITRIKNWLLSAKPPESIASYPDTLIPVKINYKVGESFEFLISPHLEGIKYTVIKWRNNQLIGGELPIETKVLEIKSIDPMP